MINGNFKEETVLYYLSSYTFLPCKSFVNAVCFFLKDETLKENNLLVEYHKNKTKQNDDKKNLKKVIFFYTVCPDFSYKNKCYVPIRTLDKYICALKKSWSLKAIRIILRILDYQNVQI